MRNVGTGDAPHPLAAAWQTAARALDRPAALHRPCIDEAPAVDSQGRTPGRQPAGPSCEAGGTAVSLVRIDHGEIVRSLDDWAMVVRADLTGAVEGLLAAGRHLLEAKEQHPGTFVSWLATGSCGVRKSYAYMLMSIAEHPVISSNAGNQLPAGDATALYQLGRLDPVTLKQAIEA